MGSYFPRRKKHPESAENTAFFSMRSDLEITQAIKPYGKISYKEAARFMPRKPRQLPAQNTLPYLLLTLTALCGEYPIRQISRLPGGSAYLESVVTALRRDGLLRTFSKDGLRGLRLTSSAKRLLLADAPEWFSDYLTGSSEPNKLKSELFKTASAPPDGRNSDHHAQCRHSCLSVGKRTPFSAASQSAAIPAYYTSREGQKRSARNGTKIKKFTRNRHFC